jgi:hypothetical protein
MNTFIVALAVFLAPGQDKPIGEISQSQFIHEIKTLGFHVVEGKDVLLVDGATKAHLSFSDGNLPQRYVQGVYGKLAFDLPHPISKREMDEWGRKNLGAKSVVRSFLGGRVTAEAMLWSMNETRAQLKESLSSFLTGCAKLAKEMARRGGKPATDVFGMGRALFKPDFKLDWVEEEDLNFIREKLHWGRKAGAGGGHFWWTGAKPLGIPIVFSGGSYRSPNLFISCIGKPDPKKADRFLRDPVPLDWSDYHSITKDEVYIQKVCRFPTGITAADLCDAILDFARKVKQLDLF